ncbi:MAG: DEAD/DEAH box helicase family protein [Bacteroidetes bacterium]|nr:DEAD/DEAH box helicase family protein [Bacteroidota bacterium]MCY4205050.1 DEAD/DEAH box helicase family protein [Bacteroidota bacterium]
MKIQFDRNLQFQLDAIASVVDVFYGQEKHESTFTVYSPEHINNQTAIKSNELGYANQLRLSKEEILRNVQQIQLSNALKISTPTEIDENRLDFTIEMETGTGKTYVYLRTIMELYAKFGFSKYVVVVPSISIKEGVYKSLQITKDHLKEIYDNIIYDYFVYNSGSLNDVRSFSTDNGLKIMVINIDAFSKSFKDPLSSNKANIIHRYNDTLGGIPLDLIRNTNPVVIVDEPQTTMSTPLRKSAVSSLNPMMILRYSATHREKINLMYKLDAVDAYTKKLVKQIEVGSVQAEGLHNQAYIKLLEVIRGDGLPKAKVEIDVLEKQSIKRKKLMVKKNTDLEQLANRTEYEGYTIKDIYAGEGNEQIDFTGREECVRLGEAIGDVDDLQVKTLMISKTIEEHLEKEIVLNKKGIKVLSLFFIDKVSNYRKYDHEENQLNGEYAKIFENEYSKLIKRSKYQELSKKSNYSDASEVHEGYFSIDGKGKKIKDTKGNSKDDENTYSLIMRDKEKLLSFDSKIRFIFSHSALREGWDNPNVFQICTLKERGASSITPRQQIGRGLRLCVDQKGNRVYGHQVNTLSVIANESWGKFAQELQKEIEAESGIQFGYANKDLFSDIVIQIIDDIPHFLGHEKSSELLLHFMREGYFDHEGKVQDILRIALKEGKVRPERFIEYHEGYHEYVTDQILNRLKSIVGKLEVRNKDKKTRVNPNRQVLLSPEFKELWERVKYKTTFSVKFDSRSLIKKCIEALDENLQIHRGKVHYVKDSLRIDLRGITNDDSETQTQSYNLNYEVEKLPDIVGSIQNATQLTRKSIVKILTGTSKLDYFKINPQKFIEGCIDIINMEMRHHIVDGIKYQKIGENEYFSQELFENEELFGYLENNLAKSKKSPHEYVVCDSKVESNLSRQFEKSQNISVYAKLPSWFKINTPLGTYNPDWVIAWKQNDEEKIYFVVESKGSILPKDLRPKELSKYRCGQSHFEELGSRLELARDLSDIESTI